MIKVLKAVPASGMTRNDFPWPESGQVECPDWIPHNECGNGLHAWIWEESPTSEGCSLEEGMTFRVVEIDDSQENMVKLEGKIKFHRGNVVGSYPSIQEAVTAQGLQSKPDRAGFHGTATAGYRGTAIAGDRGTAIAGNEGTATAGYMGTATAGYWGTVKGGRNTVLSLLGCKNEVYRPFIAVVGQTRGIKPNVFYQLNENNKFVKVEEVK